MILMTEQKRTYKITSLIKGTASLDELRALFLGWRPDESSLDFSKRVRAEGILTKQTAYRTDDLVLRVFRPWFLTPDTTAAERLQKIVQKNTDWHILNELILLYKSRAELVLYDFLTNRLWTQFHEGALYLRLADIEDFLSEAREAGFIENEWASYTKTRLAYALLRAIKEVGFVKEEKRELYSLVNYRVSDFFITYLAYDLHWAGLTDLAIVEHPDWFLFGLNRSQVIQKLSDLGEQSGIVMQQAGSVVRITWVYKSMNEVIDAYFNR
jgi:hypothetical protein